MHFAAESCKVARQLREHAAGEARREADRLLDALTVLGDELAQGGQGRLIRCVRVIAGACCLPIPRPICGEGRRTGECLDRPGVAVPVYPVRVRDGLVEVGVG